MWLFVVTSHEIPGKNLIPWFCSLRTPLIHCFKHWLVQFYVCVCAETPIYSFPPPETASYFSRKIGAARRWCSRSERNAIKRRKVSGKTTVKFTAILTCIRGNGQIVRLRPRYSVQLLESKKTLWLRFPVKFIRWGQEPVRPLSLFIGRYGQWSVDKVSGTVEPACKVSVLSNENCPYKRADLISGLLISIRVL